MTIRLPDPCLVVLVGPAGAGKSTWARRWFDRAAIVSWDDLRAASGGTATTCGPAPMPSRCWSSS